MAASLKACFKCGIVQPLEKFYVHPRMADGHLNKCKKCTKSDAAKVRSNRIDHYRAYDRARGNRSTLDKLHSYRSRNPEKYAAHGAVNNALKAGVLVRADCMICGREDSHAHHDNYDKPLDVVWLCPVHHFERHKTI